MIAIGAKLSIPLTVWVVFLNNIVLITPVFEFPFGYSTKGIVRVILYVVKFSII